MSTQRAVMINGEVGLDGEDALVAMDDGLVRGDGIFEGMRFYGRVPRTPDMHLDRLATSGTGSGIPVDRDRLLAEMARFADETISPDCAVRLMLTRGGHVIWREEPLPSFPDGIGLLPVAHRVTPLLIGVKTLSYAGNMRAQRMAREQGMNDALCFRVDDNMILEGPTTSFGWLEGDTMVFPPLEIGVLDSITRRLAMDAVKSTTREMPLEGLKDVDGAFLLSSYQECVPVHTVLGVAEFDITHPTVVEMCAAVSRHIADGLAPLEVPATS